MGFWGRIRIGFQSKKNKTSKSASTAKKILPAHAPPLEPPIAMDTTKEEEQEPKTCDESEIDVDHIQERADYHDLPGVRDGSQLDFKGGCEGMRSLSYIPSSVEFEDLTDNVSQISLVGCPSVLARDDDDEHKIQNVTQQEKDVLVQDKAEDEEGSAAIEVSILPKPKGVPLEIDVDQVPPSKSPQQILASLKRQEHQPLGVSARQKAPKQRNQLLKYQSTTRTAQLKQQIKGYFRYVPRDTEDNDVSIISC